MNSLYGRQALFRLLLAENIPLAQQDILLLIASSDMLKQTEHC